MIKTFKMLILLLVFSVIGISHSQSDSSPYLNKILKDKLLNVSYDKSIRPDTTVFVFLTLWFRQIVNLDEKNQIATTSSYLIVSWTDTRLYIIL